MKTASRKLLMPLVFISMIFCCKAQHPLPCGNGRINDSALNKALQFERSASRVQQVNYLIRVYFHVFHDDDGTGGTATRAQINSEFVSLLASYAADNICFLFCGYDTINSTNLNRNFNADNDPTGTAFNPFMVAGCINSFYLQKINGNNNACNPPCGYGGIALGGIPGNLFLISKGNIGPGNSVGHEMGHCLGLLHTFETNYGYEKIDGSNSSTAADKVTDTPADPFAYNGNACYSVNITGCLYTGTCPDPNGQTNFSPPYTNLMAYWYNGSSSICVSNPTATGGQFTRVESFLNTNGTLINCSSAPILFLGPYTVSSGYFMKSAISTLTTNGVVDLNSSTIATLGGSTVLLEPGFRASPTGNGSTRIIVRPCN